MTAAERAERVRSDTEGLAAWRAHMDAQAHALREELARWGRRALHQLRPWEDVCLYADIEQAEEA